MALHHIIACYTPSATSSLWQVRVTHTLFPLCYSCSQKYDITLVSPRNYFLYTPLLPAVATGTVEERSIVEPIRRIMAGKASAKLSQYCTIAASI